MRETLQCTVQECAGIPEPSPDIFIVLAGAGQMMYNGIIKKDKMYILS